MATDETPTPEELATIQKFCKHQAVEIETTVEFLKVGDTQPATCVNCSKHFDFKVNWDKYHTDDEGVVSCQQCGSFMLKRDKDLTVSGEPACHDCKFGPDDRYDSW